jgi:Mn2+/Fe2+ NRAMP family transporter
MKNTFAVALGILTAIGGFLDIGDLVTNSVVGSRFGLGLVWVVPVGVLGICLFPSMAGRVAAVSGRATFETIRERLEPRAAGANLGASFFINLMTVTAEIGGMALALQLASGVGPSCGSRWRRSGCGSSSGGCSSRSWRTSPGCWACP